MPTDRFEHPIRVQSEDLGIERFVETRKVESFDCGIKALNDFLNTEEVSQYESEGLGKTYLVYYQGNLVAYFTVCFDGLRLQYLDMIGKKSFSKFSEMRLESLPAIKIGRLAVAKDFQNQGIGRILIKYIAGMADVLGGGMGVRLLVLQAKPESIPFYEKIGFHLTRAVARERKRDNRTMYLDLHDFVESRR